MESLMANFRQLAPSHEEWQVLHVLPKVHILKEGIFQQQQQQKKKLHLKSIRMDNSRCMESQLHSLRSLGYFNQKFQSLTGFLMYCRLCFHFEAIYTDLEKDFAEL